jgi:hypothetical protein
MTVLVQALRAQPPVRLTGYKHPSTRGMNLS